MRWWDQAFPILHSKNDLYIQLGICVGHNNELVDRKKRQHFSKWGAPTGPDFRMILCTIPFLATPMWRWSRDTTSFYKRVAPTELRLENALNTSINGSLLRSFDWKIHQHFSKRCAPTELRSENPNISTTVFLRSVTEKHVKCFTNGSVAQRSDYPVAQRDGPLY